MRNRIRSVWLMLAAVLLVAPLAAQDRNSAFRDRVRAGQKTDAVRQNVPPARLPWLRIEGADPGSTSSLRLAHRMTWNPTSGTVTLGQADWKVEDWEISAFDGKARLQGTGRMLGERIEALATTLTLTRLDVNAVLNFMDVERADEIEGRLNGTLHLALERDRWRSIRVDLTGEPGTVRLHRRMLITIFSQIFNEDFTEQDLLDTLDQLHAGKSMIPFEDVYLRGQLGRERLVLNTRLPMPVLDITLPILVDRALLWDIFNQLREAGFERFQTVDFQR